MKTIYKLTIILSLATLLLSSCYREKPITSEIGKPRYHVDTTIPEIANLYKNTGVQVVYEFNGATVKWDLGSASSRGKYVPFESDDPKRMEIIKANLPYIFEEFIDLYPEDFKKNYMPLRIFLCDSISAVRYRTVEEYAYYGVDHIAINLYKEGEKDYSNTTKPVPFESIDAYYDKAIIKIHLALFTQLSTYKAEWPQAFLAFNEDMYDKNIIKRADAPDFDPRTYGFWTYDTESMARAWYHAVKKDKDIADFVERFITKSEAENMADMEGFPILRSKYDILRQFIKKEFGLDLQELGNKRSQRNQ